MVTFMFMWLLHVLVFNILYGDSVSCALSAREGNRGFDYDLIIIGSGAGGLFASGASTMLGMKTALVEQPDPKFSASVGGDCTNAACVPSKALRSMARLYNSTKATTFEEARRHVIETVNQVRSREDPERIASLSPDLDIYVVNNCYFVDATTICLENSRIPGNGNNQTEVILRGRKFLLATGASPVIPETLRLAAEQANLTISTYRSLLRPEEDDPIWSLGQNKGEQKRLYIVGGGATACEIGQSLARLLPPSVDIELLAPCILPQEDASIQKVALEVLTRAGITCHLGIRLDNILSDKSLILSDGRILPSADALLMCVGRAPLSLESLRLEQAGVKYSTLAGVAAHPNTLRSISMPHIYAAGDCCDAVPRRSRTAALAAWMGFHSVRNLRLPWLIVGDKSSVHPVVPRVIYTDPEIVSVGLTYRECVSAFGEKGFDCLAVREEGSDRADMERRERPVHLSFVELRADSVTGRILGCTACGPAAAEIANSIGMAVTNRLTVRDIARSLYSYPSHSYLLYRVALSLALSNLWGLASSMGPMGRVAGALGRSVNVACRSFQTSFRFPTNRRRLSEIREWQAQGATCLLHLRSVPCHDLTTTICGPVEGVSFLEVYNNKTLLESLPPSNGSDQDDAIYAVTRKEANRFWEWKEREPPP